MKKGVHKSEALPSGGRAATRKSGWEGGGLLRGAQRKTINAGRPWGESSAKKKEGEETMKSHGTRTGTLRSCGEKAEKRVQETKGLGKEA